MRPTNRRRCFPVTGKPKYRSLRNSTHAIRRPDDPAPYCLQTDPGHPIRQPAASALRIHPPRTLDRHPRDSVPHPYAPRDWSADPDRDHRSLISRSRTTAASWNSAPRPCSSTTTSPEHPGRPGQTTSPDHLRLFPHPATRPFSPGPCDCPYLFSCQAHPVSDST